MRLTHLSLTNYRNFTRLDVDVPASVVLLVGANAQGKTSLLEAIYFLATYSAFNASQDREVINFFALQDTIPVARIVADFDRSGRSHRLEVRLVLQANGNGSRFHREILLDGIPRKTHQVYGKFTAVLFLPQMLRIIDGSPEDRRRYLNQALAQVYPDYAAHFNVYSQALTQRNALLKLLYERGGDPAQLSYWDEQLALSGAHLIFARIQAVQDLEYLAAESHVELTRSQEVLRLDYRPAFDPLAKPEKQLALPIDTPLDRRGISYEGIYRDFKRALELHRSTEIARGATILGPHRDDLRFLANGTDLRQFGSRGQIRTAMLSLKLAETHWMRQRTGEWPVLLLDEVLAELDTNRRADLLNRLSGSEQAMLTTTDLDLFAPSFTRRATCWNIHAGRLQPAAHSPG